MVSVVQLLVVLAVGVGIVLAVQAWTFRRSPKGPNL